MANSINQIIDLFSLTFSLLILARVLLSWVRPDPGHPVVKFIFEVTEPILAPIRRILPQTMMFDFSPMVAWLLLDFLIVPVLKTIVTGLF